ncbi:HCP-like protein [Rhizoctonia solani 123E]|uniref:HCP-like protein n=1 Tax=Rhizoctonia solani 123E TaxID=1423351 RepID=A0A074S299_9AGAM|nr:HCP-like protein [Rhizoctonia solani 123E]
MAGPRRSPFDQADDGHHVYSPLANLVRKASNHQQSSGRIPTLRSLANAHSTGAHTMNYRPPNMRSASDESRRKYIPPSLVLRSPSPETPMTAHRRAQPSSPLLHTRFRASVATSIGSSSDLDSQHRDSQELHYHHQPHSSGSDYTPSPTVHRPFQYIIDDTHAGESPTSQYSPNPPRSPASTYTGPPSPNTAPNSPGIQFDARTSVAPSDITSPFQYDPRASSLTDTAPFAYDTQPGNTLSSNNTLSQNMMRASTRSSTAYNPRGTWRSSAAPDPDPFSFRDYEEPRVEPPIVVVHSPMSTIQDMGNEDVDGEFYLGDRVTGPSSSGTRSNSRDSNTGSMDEDVGKTSYHDAYEYVYGDIEGEDDDDATETGHQRAYVAEPASGGYASQSAGSYSQQAGAHASQPPIRDSLSQGSEGPDRFSVSEYTDSGSYFAPEPAPIVSSTSGGRVASVSNGGPRYNYSRPMRAGGGSISGTGAIQPQSSPLGTPQPGLSLNTNLSSSSGQSSPVNGPPDGRPPVRKGTGPLIFQSNSPVEERAEYPYQYSPGPVTATTESYYQPTSATSQNYRPQHSSSSQQPSISPSSQSRDVSPSPRSQPRGLSPQSSSPISQQYDMSPNSQQTMTPRSQTSPQPPSPSGRPPSLYSQYSFYSLPTSTPPESPRPGNTDQSRQVKPKASGSLLNPANQPQSQPSRSGSPNKPQPSAAQHALQLGITAHEQNNLRDSARYFERSATIEGGCGVGMLMWGLSLRHGWGCRKDERTGFKWLRKAAEAAVTDLEGARSGEEAKAVRNELVLAIYEVGQCFFHGWGVGQDKVMAVSYFQVAARLGDCDAQQELAFCYLNGKGCKKDMRQAARWYRAAAAQGASTVGLAWIYKPKYA